MRLGPWSARAAYAAATAGVVALSAMVAGAAASSARLVGVSAESRAGAQTVIIEATEPVAYSVSRPDPRTVLVELRNVSVAGAANRVRATGGSLVSNVALEDGTALDGSAVGRVRVALTGPARHRVRSTLNTIRLELEAQRLTREASERDNAPEPVRRRSPCLRCPSPLRSPRRCRILRPPRPFLRPRRPRMVRPPQRPSHPSALRSKRAARS